MKLSSISGPVLYKKSFALLEEESGTQRLCFYSSENAVLIIDGQSGIMMPFGIRLNHIRYI